MPVEQSLGLGEKTAKDLSENLKISVEGTTVKLSGDLKNIKEKWTEFDTKNNTGHFFALQLPDACKDKDVTIKGRVGGDKVIHPTAEDMLLVQRLENMSGTVLTIEMDGKTLFTVDVTALIPVGEKAFDADKTNFGRYGSMELLTESLKIVWEGNKGTASGKLKYYKEGAELLKSPGNYFPLSLSDWYDGVPKEAFIKNKKTVTEKGIRTLAAMLHNSGCYEKLHRKAGKPDTLIAWHNGIFNGEDHTFTAYDDPAFEERYGDLALLCKADTDYNPDAQCPAGFDPIAFIRELGGDGEKGRHSADVLLQAVQFAARGMKGQSGNIIFLNNVSERASGKNGKSTYMDLIANLLDHGLTNEWKPGRQVLRRSISDWGRKFQLSGLREAMVLMSDEAEGKNMIAATGVLKNLARGQAITVEDKFEHPYDYAFPGLIIHAQNEHVMLATKDDASFTHRIDISMERDFSGPNGDPDIKSRWVKDREVLEYLAKYICDMPFVDDYDPEDLEALQENTEDVKRANIPSMDFFEEVLLGDGFRAKLVPARLLKVLYDNYCDVNGFIPVSMKTFNIDLQSFIAKHPEDLGWNSGQLYLTAGQLADLCSPQHRAVANYGANAKGIPSSCVSVSHLAMGTNVVKVSNGFGSFDSNEIGGRQYRGAVCIKKDHAADEDYFVISDEKLERLCSQ